MNFEQRLKDLPHIGLGLSTEYGARSADTVDPNLLASHEHIQFLEIGVDQDVGLDEETKRWCDSGRPTTYHFLDLNLADVHSLTESWCRQALAISSELNPAWFCGDVGSWYIHSRDPCHKTLLAPVFTESEADQVAESIIRTREALGFEVFPENPPVQAVLGHLHPLDFFARVISRADTGMLLDCAHLAMVQHAAARSALDGLDNFPLDRIIELHVAGSSFSTDGWIRDTHGEKLLSETLEIFEFLLPRAPNLRAVVLEAEHLSPENVGIMIELIKKKWRATCRD